MKLFLIIEVEVDDTDPRLIDQQYKSRFVPDTSEYVRVIGERVRRDVKNHLHDIGYAQAVEVVYLPKML